MPARTTLENAAIWQYLRRASDDAYNMNVDGSGTPQAFQLVPPSTDVYIATRLLIYIRDDGVFSAEKFGSIADGLTAGCTLHVHQGDDVEIDLLDGVPIKTNAGWARVCYDADLKSWGQGDSMLAARWTLAKTGTNVAIDGRRGTGDVLEMHINDDLEDLVEFTINVQGWRYN